MYENNRCHPPLQRKTHWVSVAENQLIKQTIDFKNNHLAVVILNEACLSSSVGE